MPDQPFHEALRTDALGILSMMVLWMKEQKQDMGIFQEVFPVKLGGTLAEEAGTDLEEYHLTIVVRKKKDIPRYTIADYLEKKGMLKKKD